MDRRPLHQFRDKFFLLVPANAERDLERILRIIIHKELRIAAYLFGQPMGIGTDPAFYVPVWHTEDHLLAAFGWKIFEFILLYLLPIFTIAIRKKHNDINSSEGKRLQHTAVLPSPRLDGATAKPALLQLGMGAPKFAKPVNKRAVGAAFYRITDLHSSNPRKCISPSENCPSWALIFSALGRKRVDFTPS